MDKERMVAIIEKLIRRQNDLRLEANECSCLQIAREHATMRDGLSLALVTLKEQWKD